MNLLHAMFSDNDLCFSFQERAMLVSSDGVTLPGGLIATPMILDQLGQDSQLMLQIVNPSMVDVTIPCNTVLAKAEEVNVIQAVQQEAAPSDTVSLLWLICSI